jgi:hypothetical protein
MLKRIFFTLLLLTFGASGHAETVTRSFSDMGVTYNPIRLQGQQATFVLKLPVSPREDVRTAVLHLETANSTALIKSRSALTVRLNGMVVGQYPLDPVQSTATRDIPLPISALKPGYNDVEITAVQHYTFDCEDASSSDLWTEINAQRSSITLDVAGVRPSLNPRLTQLGVAFDPRGWLNRDIAVVSGTERVSEAQLSAASLVMEGLGQRMGVRPVRVEVFAASRAQSTSAASGGPAPAQTSHFTGLDPSIAKGRDVILIGRRAELSRYLDASLYDKIRGAFVGIFPLNEGTSVGLIVSGNTDEELLRAARAVADKDFRFSDVDGQSIDNSVTLPTPVVANSGNVRSWSDFGFRTATVQGMKLQPVNFQFRAPPDFGAQRGDLVTLKLHISYGAGLRSDSSMVLKLNGNFAASVPLSDPNGAEFSKYELRVPAQFLHPGYNSLSLEPVFLMHKDKCDLVRDDHLMMTVYEDSTIELPAASVAPHAPDLKRFSAGLWPLNETFRMYVPDPDMKTAAAALEFSALLAQQNHAPVDINVQYSPFEAGHMFVLGDQEMITSRIRDVLPLQKYTWTAEGTQAAMLQTVQDRRVVTALVAGSGSTVLAAVRSLRDHGLWNSLDGKATLIDTADNTVEVEPSDAPVSFGVASRAGAYFTDSRVILGAALLCSFIFAWAFIGVLRRKAAARERAANGNNENT